MSAKLLIYSIVAISSHWIAAFVQAFLHRLLGHNRIGGPLCSTHTGSHHAIYSGEKLSASAYSVDEKSLTAAYLAPALIIGVVAYWALPWRIFLIGSVALTASYIAHVYVHTHYHLDQTPLARWGWFRRRRVLHFVHHQDGHKNFAILRFGCDRLMGTYRDPDPIVSRSSRLSSSRKASSRSLKETC